MNKRIKELAEQNGFIHNWQPPGEQYEKLQTLEKFAELIIKECAEVLDIWNKENGAEEGLDKAGLISLWSPHFGVEE